MWKMLSSASQSQAELNHCKQHSGFKSLIISTDPGMKVTSPNDILVETFGSGQLPSLDHNPTVIFKG